MMRMDDVRAVMDAAGSRSAVIFGHSEGAALSLLFCASFPERVAGLVLFGGFAGPSAKPDANMDLDEVVRHWGSGATVKSAVAGDQPVSAEALERFGKLERLAASPGALKALVVLNREIDVTPILGSVRVPALVLRSSLRLIGRDELYERLTRSLVVDCSALRGIGWQPSVETLPALAELMRG